MNSLNTLYFPGTAIHSAQLYPLFLFFQKVHLLAPVEAGPADLGEESSDSFINCGFCQVHTPHPLGKDRKRFLHLVEDIRNRKDDYAAQLSSLTLAAMSDKSTTDESERSIVKSLFPAKEQPKHIQDQEKLDTLWQARLLLAIGEILDREEEEIAQQLALLDDEEAGLFKELHGEDNAADEENPFAELTDLGNTLRRTHAGNYLKRLKAWETLYLAAPMDSTNLLATASMDCGDIILQAYEQKTGSQAPLIGQFELPGFIGWKSDTACLTVERFTGKNGDLLTHIAKSLAALGDQESSTTQSPEETDAIANLILAWQKALEDDFPKEQCGRIPLKLYHFPGVPCTALLGNQPLGDRHNVSGLLAVVG